MKQIPLLIAAIIVLFSFVPDSRGAMTTDEQIQARFTDPGLWFWGTPTNGIVAAIHKNYGYKSELCFIIYLHKSFDTNHFPPIYQEEFSTNLPFVYFGQNDGVIHKNQQDGTYFKPTNSFCGPMELRSPDGTLVPLLDPSIASVHSYGPAFLLSRLGLRDGRIAQPLTERLPVLDILKPADYFHIQKPGRYQLTLWPKVYHRVAIEDDVCHRIDLPPVTVTFDIEPTKN